MKQKNLLATIFFLSTAFTSNSQNVGIGTANPVQKLHVNGNVFVSDSLGIGVDTPAFRLDVGGPVRIRSHVGLSPSIFFNNLTNSQLAAYIFTSIDSDIGLFGTTPANGVLMRTINGFVGIGTTDPNFLLDVNGRIRLRSGGTNFTAPGIWLNNINNSNTQSFIGMANNNQVGFYGTGLANFGLLMNTDNGEISYTGTLNMDMQLTTQNAVAPALSTFAVSVTCPQGYQVLSGGGGHFEGFGDVDIKIFFSGPTSAMNGWIVRGTNSGFVARNVSASCTCAKIK